MSLLILLGKLMLNMTAAVFKIRIDFADEEQELEREYNCNSDQRKIVKSNKYISNIYCPKMYKRAKVGIK